MYSAKAYLPTTNETLPIAQKLTEDGYLLFQPNRILQTLRMPSSEKREIEQDGLYRDASNSMQQVDPENPRHSSIINTCRRFLVAALKSNNTYSMIGNFVVAAHLTRGIYLQMLCAALAVRNELRESDRIGKPSSDLASPSWRRVPGIVLQSPGVYRYTLAVAFLQHAFEEGFSSVTGLATAFCCLGLGNLFIAHDLNREYFTRERLLPAAGLTPLTTQRSNMLRALLTNGALYWGIADILVGMQGVHNSGLTFLAAPPMFIIGIGLACSSIAAVCLKSSSSPDSPVAITLNALTNYAFAIANLTSEIGSAVSAAAGVLWGTGSLIIGANKLSKQRRSKCK